MTEHVAAPDPRFQSRTYPLYLGTPTKVMVPVVLAIFTIVGATLLATASGVGPWLFAIGWLVVIGAQWYQVLSLPYRIEASEDDIVFVSVKIRLLSQFDGFHEFVARLKAANPRIELRGC